MPEPRRNTLPDPETMCMTRLGAELNRWLCRMAQDGTLSNKSMGYRRSGPDFVLYYGGDEKHVVPHGVVRRYVRELREGFRGRHSDLD